jgi:hypothetical protein
VTLPIVKAALAVSLALWLVIAALLVGGLVLG